MRARLTEFTEIIAYSHNAAFNYLINAGSQAFS